MQSLDLQLEMLSIITDGWLTLLAARPLIGLRRKLDLYNETAQSKDTIVYKANARGFDWVLSYNVQPPTADKQ